MEVFIEIIEVQARFLDITTKLASIRPQEFSISVDLGQTYIMKKKGNQLFTSHKLRR